MTLHERAEQVVAALTVEPTKGSFEADALEWAAKCKTTDELITLIEQELRDVVEEAAQIAECLYDHRNSTQYEAYRRGDFTLDHEQAGDTIALAIRRLAKE